MILQRMLYALLTSFILLQGPLLCMKRSSSQNKDTRAYKYARTSLGQQLRDAAAVGDRTTISMLLAENAPLNEQDEQGFTPLMCAAINGHTESVELLIKEKALLNVTTTDGKSAIQLAHEYQYKDIAYILLQAGAQCDHTLKRDIIQQARMIDQTLRALAAQDPTVSKVPLLKYDPELLDDSSDASWNEKLVDQLVSSGSATLESGLPLLIHAADQGKLELVQNLIQRGISLTSKDEYGSSALTCAACHGHSAVVKELVKHGMHFITSAYNPLLEALFLATIEGTVEKAVEIAKKHPNYLFIKDDGDVTPFSYAIRYGHTQLTEAFLTLVPQEEKQHLIDRGLREAAYFGHTTLAECLLELGADLESKNRDGQTALFWAVDGDKVAMVQFLLENGANPNTEDKEGTHVLSHAMKTNDTALVSALLLSGASCTKRNTQRLTPYMQAQRDLHYWRSTYLSEDTPSSVDINDIYKQNLQQWQYAFGYRETRETTSKDHSLLPIKTQLERMIALFELYQQEDVQYYINNRADCIQNFLSNLIDGKVGTNSLLFLIVLCSDRAALRCLLRFERVLKLVNDQDKHGCTLLHYAAMLGYTDIIHLLCKNKAHVEIPDQKGNTPLIYAVETGIVENVTLLLEHSSSVDKKAYALAVKIGIKEVIAAFSSYTRQE